MAKTKEDFTCEEYAKLTLVANKVFIDYHVVRNNDGTKWQVKATMEDGFEIWEINFPSYEDVMVSAILKAQTRFLENQIINASLPE